MTRDPYEGVGLTGELYLSARANPELFNNRCGRRVVYASNGNLNEMPMLL